MLFKVNRVLKWGCVTSLRWVRLSVVQLMLKANENHLWRKVKKNSMQTHKAVVKAVHFSCCFWIWVISTWNKWLVLSRSPPTLVRVTYVRANTLTQLHVCTSAYMGKKSKDTTLHSVCHNNCTFSDTTKLCKWTTHIIYWPHLPLEQPKSADAEHNTLRLTCAHVHICEHARHV